MWSKYLTNKMRSNLHTLETKAVDDETHFLVNLNFLQSFFGLVFTQIQDLRKLNSADKFVLRIASQTQSSIGNALEVVAIKPMTRL